MIFPDLRGDAGKDRDYRLSSALMRLARFGIVKAGRSGNPGANVVH